MRYVAATLVVAPLILIFLRLPSLVDPKYYLDEGVYASVAYEIHQGGTLYKTAWDLKPPGIFYVYLFFQNLFGPHAFLVQRLFNLILGILGVWGVYQLAKQMGYSELSPIMAALLSAIFLGLPFFETQIFNTENIFMVTSLFAFILGLSGHKGGWREPFLSGLLFGIGQWLKIHPLFDLTAFGIFALYRFGLDKKFWLPFIAGFLTPILALLIYLIANGILIDFWETNLIYNLFYVEELPQITIFGNLLMRTLLLVVATAALAFLKFRNKISEPAFLLSLWFFFSLYGALLSARAYGHYFIPVLLPLTLLIPLLVGRTSLKRPGLTGVSLGLSVVLVFAAFSMLSAPDQPRALKKRIFDEQLNYYQIRLSYILGKTTPRQFEQNFTPKPWRLRELKAYLDGNFSKDEEVYLWGISPWANYILERSPVQRYLVWFHVLGVGRREEEVYQNLLAEMPEVIIVEDTQPEGEVYQISRSPFPKLQNFIDTNYQFDANVAGYAIYRLTPLAVV